MSSRHVPVLDKLLFTAAVALYWALPDLLPFLPIDDVTVTAFAAHWFVNAMERKYGNGGSRTK